MNTKKEYPLAAVRIRVMKRDKFRCTYCGASGNDVELEIDHIHPISKGGSNHMSNLTTACRSCNQSKSNGKLEPMTQARQTSGLVGIFIHTLKEGRIHNQGEIIGTDADVCLVQRYSWLSGCPTDVIGIPKADILNQEKCRMYSSGDDAVEAWEKERRQLDAAESYSRHNANVDLPDTAAQDSASKLNNPAVSG